MKKRLLFVTDHWIIGDRKITPVCILENISNEFDRELLFLLRTFTKIDEERKEYLVLSYAPQRVTKCYNLEFLITDASALLQRKFIIRKLKT